MLITVKTFDGVSINDGSTYQAWLTTNIPASARPGFVDQANNDPQWSGTFTGDVKTLPLMVKIKNYALRYSLGMTMRDLFQRGARGKLVCTFSDDGLDYELDVVVVSCTPKNEQYFTVVLNGEHNAWRRSTASTDTWSVTASGATKTLTVAGGTETRLSVAITPTGGASSGAGYHGLYQLVNKPGIDYGLRPWCITIDTATLVSASQMRADGYDLQVVVNDQPVKRWIVNPNTSTTHVWFNANINEGYALTLLTPVASSGNIGELVFKKTDDNKAALKAMPNSGIIYHGTEWFQYSGKNTKTYKLGITKRGALSTAMQAHAAADVFYYIQNVIYVVSGNASATNPSANDATYDYEKPVFDLASSNNNQWVYTASTLFRDEDYPSRTGDWTVTVKRKGDTSGEYDFTQNAESGAPALGALIGTWDNGGRAQSENATITWQLNCPGGIFRVSMTGSKFRNTTLWPATAALQRSKDGKKFANVWTESSPVSLSTWTPFTHSLATMSAAAKMVQLIFSGKMAATADALAYFEVLTCTVEFTSANIPTGTLMTISQSFPLGMTITNNTTGDAVTITYPMRLNKTFTLNGEDFEATYDGVNAHGAMSLNDESRSAWIRLAPGSNVLSVALGDVGPMTLALSWYSRRI